VGTLPRGIIVPASKALTSRRLFAYLCVVIVLALARPTPILLAIGAGIVVVGEILRLWACGHLRKNKDVITSGPYAHVKNPLYLGTFLILVGFCIAASNLDNVSRFILIAALPFFLGVFFVYYLPYKMKVEGDRLRKRFGENFDTYDRNVPAFVPRLSRWDGAQKLKWNAALVVENSEVPTAVWCVFGLAIITLKLYVPFP
jgi:protein-S-isoprenylcysteine O-methyltransferase Ste14